MNYPNNYKGDIRVFEILNKLNINFEYYEHLPAPTIEIASKYWKDIEAQHCKNLFFRNHKGNKHFLVILDCNYNLNIKDLEKRLKQGKLTFASEKRLIKYLNLQQGSVSPFGLINDTNNHVHVFLDKKLLEAKKISFHPNINTVSLVISIDDFLKYLKNTGNSFEFTSLY
jgi:Ala-tRNA(Pro) deacylase